MNKLLIMLLILTTTLFARAPFLTQGLIPHYTQKIAKNWDDNFLELSPEQKSRLLYIKEETMKELGRIKKLLEPLEQEVADRIINGEKPENLSLLVQDIAKYKSEATMIHLRCVYNTQQVLSKEQLELLPSL